MNTPKLTVLEISKVLDQLGIPDRTLEKYKTLAKEKFDRPEDYEKYLNAVKSAEILWSRIVDAVGERAAKDIMQRVMSAKKAGRQLDRPLFLLIYMYIRLYGLAESDEAIAKRILDRNPNYVRFDTGAIFVTNDWQTETKVAGDHKVIDRWPLDKQLKTLAKQVSRIRKSKIEDGTLPKEYAPRRYHHD